MAFQHDHTPAHTFLVTLAQFSLFAPHHDVHCLAAMSACAPSVVAPRASVPARGPIRREIRQVSNGCQLSIYRSGTSRRCVAVEASPSKSTLAPLPQTCAEQVSQCAEIVRHAASPEGGSHKRQRVTLLLPINNRRNEFTSVEADDYGQNDADIYKAAMVTASALIRLIEPDGGEMFAKRVDTDNDPVGVLQNAKGSVRALVIPNAQDLNVLRDLAALGDANRTQITLLVNPQWNEQGQVVSDFGLGPWRKRAMDFLGTFLDVYSLTESRIGAAATRDPAKGGDFMGVGGVARVLKTNRSAYQVFAMGQDGSSECVCEVCEPPLYDFLEKEVFIKEEYSLLCRRSGDEAGPSLEKRLERSVLEAAGTDGGSQIDWSIASTAEITAAVRARAIGANDVAGLDKTAIRTALGALGLPTSGKLETMRERLREALLGEDREEWDY